MTLFFRLLEPDDKGTALHQAIQQLAQQQRSAERTSSEPQSNSSRRSPNPNTFAVEPESFQQVPGATFAYWVSEKILQKFSELEPLESGHRKAKLGLNTTDDTRFLRLWFEVNVELLRLRWFPIFKGGGYAPYFQGSYLVIDWENKGQRLKEYITFRGDSPSRNVRSEALYFFPGLTYSSRTQKGLAFQPLPTGSLFTPLPSFKQS